MRVIAMETGFYGGSRRRPGDEFEMAETDLPVEDGEAFLPAWVYPASSREFAMQLIAKREKDKEEKMRAGAIAASAPGAKGKMKTFADAMVGAPLLPSEPKGSK